MSDRTDSPPAAAQWQPMHFSAAAAADTWPAPSPRDGRETQEGFSSLYAGDNGGGFRDGDGSGAADNAAAHQVSPGQASADIEALRQEAYQEGLARGEADGFAAGMEKAAEAVENLHRLLTAAEALWPTLCRTYEHQIIALVGQVAEKVVCGQVAMDRDVVRRTILKAFDQIPEPVAVDIEVNPEDYEYLEALKKDLMAEIRGLKQLRLQSDPAISRGGCRIETRSGAIDATLEARLEAVRQSLLETAPPPEAAKADTAPAGA